MISSTSISKVTHKTQQNSQVFRKKTISQTHTHTRWRSHSKQQLCTCIHIVRIALYVSEIAWPLLIENIFLIINHFAWFLPCDLLFVAQGMIVAVCIQCVVWAECSIYIKTTRTIKMTKETASRHFCVFERTLSSTPKTGCLVELEGKKPLAAIGIHRRQPSYFIVRFYINTWADLSSCCWFLWPKTTKKLEVWHA